MSEPWSFDSTVAATASTANQADMPLPPDQQTYGRLWPVPAEQVSQHGPEGVWLPTARDIPHDPPAGPLWAANHDGPALPATSHHNQAAPARGNHDGDQHKAPVPQVNMGQPFTVQVTRFLRRLATDVWDSTGKRVSPVDAPSAPVQIFGSFHNTTPRLTPSERAPLKPWAWATGPTFTGPNPGYLGVSNSEPDMAARPFGAEAANSPSDPYVLTPAAAPSAAPGGGPAIDYDTGW